jgi:hypothetical protein
MERPAAALGEVSRLGSSWACRAAPAQGEALGAPDEIDERLAGLEGEGAVGCAGQHGDAPGAKANR